ncbi:Rrf2 family transcriptional regulator [Listeria monocytogenes]|nr:Rrf2 family transcriptional regulator [Listeria monocytogenes]GAT40639.1 Rrf2 family transcriptional regulator [Listeria monocytogenes]
MRLAFAVVFRVTMEKGALPFNRLNDIKKTNTTCWFR